MSTPAPTMPRRLHRLRRRVLFPLVAVSLPLVAALSGLYVLRFRPRREELRDTRKPEAELSSLATVDDLTMRRLGHVDTEKTSAFVRFPTAKPAGVTRLCAFGDSYTQGDEVAEAHDYPSFLQRLLDQRAPGRFEVLNFGASWHGFHQAFMMWKFVGRQYGCDRVLLGPRAFQPYRDTRFNHTDYSSPYFLHARYVLDGGGVRLIDVIGDTHEERFDSYFRFFPHWRYLRYDRNPPFLLQSILPRGRSLPVNPFYYHWGNAQDEAGATYRVLLTEMTKAPTPILLGHYSRWVTGLAAPIPSDRLAVAWFSRRTAFPYLAPRGHNSAWGNQVVAEQFLSLSTGVAARPVILLTAGLDAGPATGIDPPEAGGSRQSRQERSGTPSVEQESADGPTVSRPPLSSYDDVAVTLQGAVIGRLFPPLQSAAAGAPADLPASETASLVTFIAPQQNLLDGCFVALAEPLRPGAPVTLRLNGNSPPVELPLGNVRLVDPRVNLGVVEMAAAVCFGQRGWRLRADHGPLAEQREKAAGGVEVLVDRVPVLRGRWDAKNGLILHPVLGDLLHLAAPANAFLDPAELPDRGLLGLALSRPQETLEVPLARWWKAPMAEAMEQLRPSDPPLDLPADGPPAAPSGLSP